MQSLYIQGITKIFADRSNEKTKPIQTQLKPKQTQFKPNKAKNKANSNPIYRKAKNELFCVDKELYNYIRNATRGFYHPKGCQFKPNFDADPESRVVRPETDTGGVTEKII